MKNGKNLLVVFVLLALLAGLFAGCGGNKSKDEGSAPAAATEQEKPAEDTAAKDEASKEEAPASTDGTVNPVLQQMVDEAQSQISSLKDAFGGIMDIAISARGDAVVYTYTYTIDFDDSAISTLTASMDAQEAAMNQIAKSLQSAGVEKGAVIIEVVSKDGKELYKREFKG